MCDPLKLRIVVTRFGVCILHKPLRLAYLLHIILIGRSQHPPRFQDSLKDELQCMIDGRLKNDRRPEKIKRVEGVISRFKALCYEVGRWELQI